MEDYSSLKLLLNSKIPVMQSSQEMNYSYNASFKQNQPLIFIEKESNGSKYVRTVYDLSTSIYYLRRIGIEEIIKALKYYRDEHSASFMKTDTYYSFSWTYGLGPFMKLPACKKFSEEVKNIIINPNYIISFFDVLKESKMVKD